MHLSKRNTNECRRSEHVTDSAVVLSDASPVRVGSIMVGVVAGVTLAMWLLRFIVVFGCLKTSPTADMPE